MLNMELNYKFWNFKSKFESIYRNLQNVYYVNENTKIKADKVEIDLLDKKLKISMINKKDKVNITSKYWLWRLLKNFVLKL